MGLGCEMVRNQAIFCAAFAGRLSGLAQTGMSVVQYMDRVVVRY